MHSPQPELTTHVAPDTPAAPAGGPTLAGAVLRLVLGFGAMLAVVLLLAWVGEG